jgi:quinol monooxygenase YgiN
MIIVTGAILAHQDSFTEVLRLSREHVERSRNEDGCISHDVHVDTENPLRLFFFEQWRDEPALRAHFAVPASREFVKALRSLIVETSGTKIWQAEKIER